MVGRQYNFKFEVFVQKVLLKLRYNISNLCVANFYTRCFISTLVNQASSNSKDLILSTLESVKGWYGINNIYLVIALGLNIAIEKLLMFQLFLSKLKLILQPSGLVLIIRLA